MTNKSLKVSRGTMATETTGARIGRTGIPPFLYHNVILCQSPTMSLQTSLTPMPLIPTTYQMDISSRSSISTLRQVTVTNAGTPSNSFAREILMGEDLS